MTMRFVALSIVIAALILTFGRSIVDYVVFQMFFR